MSLKRADPTILSNISDSDMTDQKLSVAFSLLKYMIVTCTPNDFNKTTVI